MNKIFTLAFSLLLSFGGLYAQKIDYDNSSKWYLGFNFGATWQTTDVANRTSGGWGLTLGRSYNYNYGKRLSFDIRGRYLGGYWYGQDLKVTDSAGYKGVALKPYMDSLGFAVNNFQTELHNLSLELVLHANGIRERSGWDPYIFGGIGIKWYQTFGDLYFNDSLGGIYNYDQNLLSKSYLNTVSDGVYETALEGSQQEKFTVGLMPSLGFGIGYQVGKRVTLGLEHKTTFTLTDDFDGYAAEGKYKQDLYHYTSAFINFRFRRGVRGGGSSGATGVGNIDNYNSNTNNLTGCNSPVITYMQPSSAGMNVNAMTYSIVADIKEVLGKENITFKHNGVNSLNFTYNPTTDRLEAQVILTPGSNMFEIYATNTCGSDNEGMSVNYQNCVAPVISRVNPSGASASVSTPAFAFSAFISNVNNPQSLTLTVNNRNVTDYTMNSTTGVFQANLNLIPGANTVVVTATNTCGTATETVTINYQNCVSPVITIVDPATSGSTVNKSAYFFNATVQNVTNSNTITLKQNNVSITSFSFNATTGMVQNNLTLKPGLNTLVLSATNGCGSDSKTVTINYTREVNNTGGGNTGGGNQEQKITICHYPPGNNGNPQTIEIPLSAWPAHQAHGDKLGPCPEVNNNTGGGNDNGGGNQEQKITICHYPPGNNGNPQTIEIPLSAWPAHQAHGDKLGPCDNSGTGNNGGNPSGNNGSNGNNGHGNNTDGVDSSNPGQGNGGPNGEGDGSGDDENGNGNQDANATNGSGSNNGGGPNGNNGSNGNNGNSGGNGNNGHGNNTDGVDSSNPGQGNGGPNGEADGSGDDENVNGNQDPNATNGSGSNNGGDPSGNNSSNGNENGANDPGTGSNNSSGNSPATNENGSTGNGGTSNENGSGQGENNNGSGNSSEQSGNGTNSNENGSGQEGSNGNSGNGSGGNNGNNGGGNGNKNKSVTTEPTNGNGGKPAAKPSGSKITDQKPASTKPVEKNETKPAGNQTKPEAGKSDPPAAKPSGTKVTDQKPGTLKPAEQKEPKQSGTETKSEGGKTEKPSVKPTELKPSNGGGKGGKG